MTTPARRATPELNALVDLFYEDSSRLGTFTEVPEAAMSPSARRLLAHDAHMTVTLEAYYACPVTVEVLQTVVTPTHYSRKSLLHRQTDGRVVQLGLVRLAVALLDSEVRQEIESQRVPLGRVLIQHGIMRNVRLLSLWQISPGEELCQRFQLSQPETCFGRTALIYCDGVPAVELLEIVAPD